MVAIVPCFVSGGSGRCCSPGSETGPGSRPAPWLCPTRRHHAGLGRPRVRGPAGCRRRAARARRSAPREPTAAHALARPLSFPSLARLATGALAASTPRHRPVPSRCSRPGRPPCRGWSPTRGRSGVCSSCCARAPPTPCASGAVPRRPNVPGDLPRRRRRGAGGPRARPRRRPGMAICLAAGTVAALRSRRPPRCWRLAPAGGHQQCPGAGRDDHRACVMAEVLDRRRDTATDARGLRVAGVPAGIQRPRRARRPPGRVR